MAGQKSTQKQFLVKVTGIDGYFATFSGGRVAAEARKVFDGGSLVPDVISGPAQVDNFSVGRHYDYYRDGALITRLRKEVGLKRYTVSKTPTNAALVPIGPPDTFTECLLIGVNVSDYSSDGGDVATFELEFSPAAIS